MSAAEIQQMELPFSQADKVQMLVDSNRHLEGKNEALREENTMLRRMLFGKKSEKLIHETIALEETEEQEKEAAELPVTEQAKSHSSTQPKRKRRLSATVTNEIEHLVVPEEVLQNPLAYTRLPESSYRITRRLEYVPGHFELHIYRMPSFVKTESGAKPGRMLPYTQPRCRGYFRAPIWEQVSLHWLFTINTACTSPSTAR